MKLFSYLTVNKYYRMTDKELRKEALYWKIRGYEDSNGVVDRDEVIDALLKKDKANESKHALFIALFSLAISFFGNYYSYIQIREIRSNQMSRGFDYMTYFSKELLSGKNLDLILSIEDDKPLLKDNGGNFTTKDFDTLLGTYYDINTLRIKGLITDDLLYENFAFDLANVYSNREIMEYLEEIRREDAGYYSGFDDLQRFFVEYAST